jgi:hypothetical protein
MDVKSLTALGDFMVLHFVSCGANPSADWLMLANECLEKNDARERRPEK